MSVKNIFITLIIVVACVMIGALILNTLLPNVTATLVNSVEDMIFNATGMKFDFNNDGNMGAQGDSAGGYTGAQTAGDDAGANGGNVDGFQ